MWSIFNCIAMASVSRGINKSILRAVVFARVTRNRTYRVHYLCSNLLPSSSGFAVFYQRKASFPSNILVTNRQCGYYRSYAECLTVVQIHVSMLFHHRLFVFQNVSKSRCNEFRCVEESLLLVCCSWSAE